MQIKENMLLPDTHKLRGLILWLVLFLICLILQFQQFSDVLRFDRYLINDGHWWLILSGNLVHLSWGHFWLNMAGLSLVAIFFNHYYSLLEWLALLTLSAIFVGLGLYWLNPDLIWYVGLSGVLHGLFIAGAWQEFRHYAKSGGLLLLLIIGKLIWEQLMGAMPGSESMSGGRVMVDAHLYGGFAGGIFVVLYSLKEKYLQNHSI